MSAAPLKIRTVEGLDLPVLTALHEACFTAAWDQRWSQKSFAEVLAMPGAGARIAAIGSEPIGFALARIAADEAELLLIGIHPEYRRGGYGSTLLRHVVDALQRAGARQVFLEVAEHNQAAAQFYRARGFRQVGRRAGYFGGEPAVDALVLARSLSAGSSAISPS
jgi:ribosomal-protein-alanine N-acetyltransferase